MIDAYSQEFKNRQSPQWWYNKASQLHASAGVVWHFGVENEVPGAVKEDLGFPDSFSLQAGCYPVFPFLSGLAIETLLKGIIVLSGGKVEFKHTLVDHAESAKIQLDETLKKNLSFLSETIIWAGRYPVPKKEDHLRNHWRNHSHISWSWKEHKTIWDRFVNEFFARKKDS